MSARTTASAKGANTAAESRSASPATGPLSIGDSIRQSCSEASTAGFQGALHKPEANRRNDSEQNTAECERQLRHLHHPGNFQPSPRRAFAAPVSLVRDRKLTPKNLMNDASVSALVRMAITAHNDRYFADLLP